MKKKILIILLVLVVIVAGVSTYFIMKKHNESNNEKEDKLITGVEWGDIYYEYIKENIDNEAVVPQNIENGSIQFIQLEEDKAPIMVTIYNDLDRDNASVLDVKFIDDDNVRRNVFARKSFTRFLL